MTNDDDGPGWRRPLAILASITVIAALVLVFTGSQVSGILSTVGSSVGPPGEGIVGSGVGAGQVGGGTDTGSGTGGSGSGTDLSSAGSGGGSGSGSDLARSIDAGRPDLLVIKTGEIALEAENIGAAMDHVTARIVALGGYVSASQRSRADETARASITFRVPAARWEEALAAARGAGDKVLDEQSATEDVTGQVVDLRARAKNLQASEKALQAIMDRAGSIKDVLSVQTELTKVRGEIEALTAQATKLEEQAALSTLKVVVSVPEAVVAAPPEAEYDPTIEVDAATDQLVENAQRLTTTGIWFGIVWLPMLAGLAVVIAVGLFVARRVWRALGAGPGLAADPEGGA